MREKWLEQIESYLQGEMSDEEKKLFEEDLAGNEAMRKDLNTYRSIEKDMENSELDMAQEAAFKKTLGEMNAVYFPKIKPQPAPVISIKRNKWMPYAVAAILLAAVALYFFIGYNNPRQLAKEYISEKLERLSQNMDASTDNLQKGLLAYNDKKYDEALVLFDIAYKADSANSDAKIYIGLSYLKKKDYGSAISVFKELALFDLQSNPGKFYEAIARLQRNEKTDKEQAKILLEEVLKNQLYGNDYAKKWLNKF